MKKKEKIKTIDLHKILENWIFQQVRELGLKSLEIEDVYRYFDTQIHALRNKKIQSPEREKYLKNFNAFTKALIYQDQKLIESHAIKIFNDSHQKSNIEATKFYNDVKLVCREYCDMVRCKEKPCEKLLQNLIKEKKYKPKDLKFFFQYRNTSNAVREMMRREFLISPDTDYPLFLQLVKIADKRLL